MRIVIGIFLAVIFFTVVNQCEVRLDVQGVRDNFTYSRDGGFNYEREKDQTFIQNPR